jgi:hypothetical protein
MNVLLAATVLWILMAVVVLAVTVAAVRLGARRACHEAWRRERREDWP